MLAEERNIKNAGMSATRVQVSAMGTLKRFLSFVTEAVGEFESIGTTRAFAKELNNNTREHSSALRT
jgi:hypothetical protein